MTPPTYTVTELIENYTLTVYKSPTILTRRDTSSFPILILKVYAASNVSGLKKKNQISLQAVVSNLLKNQHQHRPAAE